MPDDFNAYPLYAEHTAESGFNIWDRLPGTEFLTDEETRHAFDLFYEGFVEGGNPDARQDFLDYFGYDEGDFNWEDWREWMGYD